MTLHGEGRVSTRKARVAVIVMVAPLAFGACATTGATLGSGVGDAFPEHPPYYAGAERAAGPGRGVPATGHIPIAYQRGAAQAAIFDPSVTDAMAALLAEMNAYLDSLGVTTRLVDGGRVSAVTHAATRHPPDVQFGCVTATGAPDDDCAVDGDEVLGRKGQRMRLAVARPSPEWSEWMGETLTGQGVERALVITLEIGPYLVRQRGLLGHKEVELGTSHVVDLPWLTSLETPVTVLQLTGALVGRDGKAVRIGAEGLLVRRTSLPLSAVRAQALISDDDVERLRTARRDDLVDRPVVWQAGLLALVDNLVGVSGAR